MALRHELLERLLASRLNLALLAVVVSTAVGSGFFLSATAIAVRKLGTPVDISWLKFTAAVYLVGIPLMTIVVSDVAKKIIAKYRLGAFLAQLRREDLDQLRLVISSTRFPALLRYPSPNERFDPTVPGWVRLLEFLDFDSFGRVASRALFQPSAAGRINYLESAMRQAERRQQRQRVSEMV